MRGFLKIAIWFFSFFLLFSLSGRSISAQDIFWSTPTHISQSSNQALLSVVSTDSKGYVHSAWMESAETDWKKVFTPTNRPTPGIFYSFWNGDTWSEPVQVNTPAKGFSASPSITVTPNDNVHVVWDEDAVDEEWESQVYYARWNGSSWSTPISLTTAIHKSTAVDGYGSYEWNAIITSDSSNNLYVIFAYSDDNRGDSDIYYTKYTNSTSSWSQPVSISQGLDAQLGEIAVDSSGNIHFLFMNIDEFGINNIYYTYYNGSTWSSAQLLKTWATIPRLIVDSSNNLHAAWSIFNYTTRLSSIEYSRKPAGSAWSTPYVVSTTVATSRWGAPLTGLTTDASGNAYVGWGQYNSTWYDDTWCSDTSSPGCGSYGVDAMYRKYTVATSTWSNPNLVRSTKYLDAPTIWRDKWWNQHFVWSEMDIATNQWQFWYSEVPANSSQYNPSSALTITMAVTGDKLDIPSAALASAVTISAQVGPVPASADPLVTTIPRSYTFRPHGTTFLAGKSATATIYYADAEVLGTDEKNLKVHIWDATANGGLGGWTTSFTTGVNTGANRITADLPHFSLYGIMGPRAQKKVNLTWRPPISNSELYTMVDGSTLPIKFTLTYEGGASVETPTLADDLVVYIRRVVNGEISELGVLEYKFGVGVDNVRYDPVSAQYILNLKTKALDLDPGIYNVKVLHKGFNWGTLDFQITEPGKVKGATTP